MHIIHQIKRVDPSIIAEFCLQDAATVHEAMGRKGAMHSSIRPVYKGLKLCGSAITVKSHLGDNLMLQKALEMAKPGDILVADTGDCTEAGSWGELMTWQAKMKGLKGLVSNGSIRDTAQIRKMDFPVFCKGISIKGTVKETVGLINHPISCGGVIVSPGDIILGDDDGIVVIPFDLAEEALSKAKARIEKETKIIERIRNGESMFDIMGFGEKLKDKGCIE